MGVNAYAMAYMMVHLGTTGLRAGCPGRGSCRCRNCFSWSYPVRKIPGHSRWESRPMICISKALNASLTCPPGLSKRYLAHKPSLGKQTPRNDSYRICRNCHQRYNNMKFLVGSRSSMTRNTPCITSAVAANFTNYTFP